MKINQCVRVIKDFSALINDRNVIMKRESSQPYIMSEKLATLALAELQVTIFDFTSFLIKVNNFKIIFLVDLIDRKP